MLALIPLWANRRETSAVNPTASRLEWTLSVMHLNMDSYFKPALSAFSFFSTNVKPSSSLNEASGDKTVAPTLNCRLSGGSQPANPGRRLDFSTSAVSIGLARCEESRVTFYPLQPKRFAMSKSKAQKADHGP